MGVITSSLGTMMAAILIGGVGIPITQDVIQQNNFTGMTALIVGFVPVGMATSLLISAFRPVLSLGGGATGGGRRGRRR